MRGGWVSGLSSSRTAPAVSSCSPGTSRARSNRCAPPASRLCGVPPFTRHEGGRRRMRKFCERRSSRPFFHALLLAALGSCAGASPSPARSMKYAHLISLFTDWREFQKPKLVDVVPDYTPAAMAAQQRALAGYQQRLAAIDPRDWPVAQQADYHAVRAEMNGLDFDHRVLRPWERNPGFYVGVVADQSDQPAREGPFAYGTLAEGAGAGKNGALRRRRRELRDRRRGVDPGFAGAVGADRRERPRTRRRLARQTAVGKASPSTGGESEEASCSGV